MSKGKMALVNSEGKKMVYDVEAVNGFMVLKGKDGIFCLREDGRQEIVAKLKREISEMEEAIIDKKAIIAKCKRMK